MKNQFQKLLLWIMSFLISTSHEEKKKEEKIEPEYIDKPDFILGMKDYKNGVVLEDCPFLLRFRAKLWKAGWRYAKNER